MDPKQPSEPQSNSRRNFIKPATAGSAPLTKNLDK